MMLQVSVSMERRCSPAQTNPVSYSNDDLESTILQPGIMIVELMTHFFPTAEATAADIARLSETYKTIRFYSFEFDTLPDLARKMDVRAIPTYNSP